MTSDIENNPAPAPAIATNFAPRRSLFAASHLAAQQIVLNAISVPVMAYIIRSMGDKGYGQWTTALPLVAVAGGMTNLGLRGTFVRSVARDHTSAQQALAEQLGLRLLLCLLVAPIAIGITAALYEPTIIECAAVAAVGLCISTFVTTLSDLLQGMNLMSVYAGSNFIGGLALTAASVLAAWRYPSPVTMALAYLAGPLVAAVILFIYVRRQLFPVQLHWNLGRFGQLLKHSRFFAAQQFVNMVTMNAEGLLLPKAAGPIQYGFFNAGSMLPQRLGIINESLGSAFYPAVANAYHRDPKLASREVMRLLMLTQVVCLPVVIAVTFVSAPVAHILFGANAEICKTVIRITIFALPLLGLESVVSYTLNAAGKDAALAKSAFYATPFNLIMAVILVWHFGVLGACWSSLLRPIVRTSFVIRLFIETFSLTLSGGRLLRVLLCGGAMVAAMWLTRSLVPTMDWSKLHGIGVGGWTILLGGMAAQSAIGAAVYGAAMFVLGVVRGDDIKMLLSRKRNVEAETP